MIRLLTILMLLLFFGSEVLAAPKSWSSQGALRMKDYSDSELNSGFDATHGTSKKGPWLSTYVIFKFKITRIKKAVFTAVDNRGTRFYCRVQTKGRNLDCRGKTGGEFENGGGSSAYCVIHNRLLILPTVKRKTVNVTWEYERDCQNETTWQTSTYSGKAKFQKALPLFNK